MLVERKIRNFRMMLDTEDKGMSTQLLAGGGWEGEAPDILESIIEPGMVVVEMGACIGFYMLVEAACGATVYAIEPDPHNVEMMRKSLDLNGFTRARAYELAIGGVDGTAHFHRSRGRSDRGRLSPKGLEVKVLTLDTFARRAGITRLDVLRCDIEGAEVGMVSGGRKTLEMARWLFIDLHPLKMKRKSDLIPTVETIMGHGFSPQRVFGSSVDPGAADFATAICNGGGYPKVFFRKCE